MTLRPLNSALESWRPAPAAGGDPLAAIAAAWTAIVGARVAQHSAPLGLEKGVLLVGTRSAAWSQQLEFLAPQILARIAESLPQAAVTRLRFRNGGLRRPRPSGGTMPARADATAQRGPAPEAATDERDALERVRRRMRETRRRAAAACSVCGAPIETGGSCAPCAGAVETARRIEIERVFFSSSWLSTEEVRAIVGGADDDEIERVRHSLLQRWWAVLERAQRAGRALSRRERQVASSYVLLHSGLPPERVTPAVVRNLLGAELESQLSGAAASN